MKFGIASFNVKWVATKTLEEFKDHESHHGLSEKQLEEAYDLCLKAANVQEAVQEKGKVSSRKANNKG